MRLQTLDRGLELLEWVASNPGNASVRQAAVALGVNMTTCYHLVDTLISRGYLVRTAHAQLGVGTALTGLSRAFVEQARPLALLSPVVGELLEESQESVFLAIWDGDDVILLLFQEGPQHLTVSGFSPGFRGLAHARCSGKAILAFLPGAELDRYFMNHELTARTPHSITDEYELRSQLAEVRSKGWAYEKEEFFVGICSLGAPFFGADGRVLGALSLALPAARYADSTERCHSAVVLGAEKASRMLGYLGHYPPHAPE